MSSEGSQFQINAPQDMYTMASARINHFIQPHEWAVIRSGSGSAFFNCALGLLSASMGFLQNLYNMTYGGTASKWDQFGSMVFFGLFFSGIALLVVSYTKKSDFQKVIEEVDGRPLHPM